MSQELLLIFSWSSYFQLKMSKMGRGCKWMFERNCILDEFYSIRESIALFGDISLGGISSHLFPQVFFIALVGDISLFLLLFLVVFSCCGDISLLFLSCFQFGRASHYLVIFHLVAFFWWYFTLWQSRAELDPSMQPIPSPAASCPNSFF